MDSGELYRFRDSSTQVELEMTDNYVQTVKQNGLRRSQHVECKPSDFKGLLCHVSCSPFQKWNVTPLQPSTSEVVKFKRILDLSENEAQESLQSCLSPSKSGSLTTLEESFQLSVNSSLTLSEDSEKPNFSFEKL